MSSDTWDPTTTSLSVALTLVSGSPPGKASIEVPSVGVKTVPSLAVALATTAARLPAVTTNGHSGSVGSGDGCSNEKFTTVGVLATNSPPPRLSLALSVMA